jgi:MFS superfamily sulfate permease-like transporter
LVAVIVASALDESLEQFAFDLKDIQVPQTLAAALTLPTWEDLPRLLDRSILVAGLTLAFIASAESLLTATAVDTMQQHTPRTNYDRELVAQGSGNFLCGVLGVLPVTGVIVRSAANVHAGAQTRLSTVMHGLWLLLFAMLLPVVLRMVPVASLAAILVYTGCKPANPRAVLALWRYGKGEVAVYGVTLGTIVIFDLLTGTVFGLWLAVGQLVYRFSHLSIRIEKDGERTVLFMEGAATCLRLPKLAAALEQVPPKTELHVHFAELSYVDHACLDLLMNWEKQHESTGGSLVIDWENLTAKFLPPSAKNGKNGRPVLTAGEDSGDGEALGQEKERSSKLLSARRAKARTLRPTPFWNSQPAMIRAPRCSANGYSNWKPVVGGPPFRARRAPFRRGYPDRLRRRRAAALAHRTGASNAQAGLADSRGGNGCSGKSSPAASGDSAWPPTSRAPGHRASRHGRSCLAGS